MAESYEDLKKKYNVSLQTITKNQMIISEYKNYVEKLKRLLEITKKETEDNKNRKEIDCLKKANTEY